MLSRTEQRILFLMAASVVIASVINAGYALRQGSVEAGAARETLAHRLGDAVAARVHERLDGLRGRLAFADPDSTDSAGLVTRLAASARVAAAVLLDGDGKILAGSSGATIPEALRSSRAEGMTAAETLWLSGASSPTGRRIVLRLDVDKLVRGEAGEEADDDRSERVWLVNAANAYGGGGETLPPGQAKAVLAQTSGVSIADGVAWSWRKLSADDGDLVVVRRGDGLGGESDSLIRFDLLLALLVSLALTLTPSFLLIRDRLVRPMQFSVDNLSSSSMRLRDVSANMTSSAQETSAQAVVVSAAADEVSQNSQMVATGVEQMRASVSEVAASATEAAMVASSTVEVAERTNTTVSKLGESSQEIGKIIKVIHSIAEQTNMLALNATIEAARAGAAGKGFAVVANEVKELAKQTSHAAEDIARKIEAIQIDSREAVEAIEEITTIIGKINELQNTIASAVEEQAVTTNEISRAVQESARGSAEIAENMGRVAEAAEQTTRGAEDTRSAATGLTIVAEELTSMIGASATSSEGSDRD